MSKYKDKLQILRKRIPVGLRHGLALLEGTNGDIEQCVVLFQEEVLMLIIDKTGVPTEFAKRHLALNNYDIVSTIESIDEERYTLTERFLRRYKNNKEEALANVANSIVQTANLERDPWLNLENLDKLNPHQYCLITIYEWLSYEDWEPFDAALNFWPDIVTDQIDKQLLLTDLANCLRKAREIQVEIYRQYKNIKDNVVNISNALGENKEFKRFETYFLNQRNLLIDTLYDFVKNNSKEFP